MHLTTHGNLICVSDPLPGVVVITAPASQTIESADWLDAIDAHGVSTALVSDWDYRETDTHVAWMLVTTDTKVVAE